MRGWVALVGIGALCLAAVGCGGGPPRVAVGTLSAPGAVVPRSFLGLSVELTSVEAYARDPGFLALARRLGRAQRAPLALRVGGNSTDESLYLGGGGRAATSAPRGQAARRPAPGPVRPPGVLNVLGPGWPRALFALRRGTGDGPLTLGLDLAHRDVAADLRLLRATRRAGVARVELGNEPDLFTRARTFRVGRLVVHRPRERATYDPTAYAAEAAALARAVKRTADVKTSVGTRDRGYQPTSGAVGAERVAAGGLATPKQVGAWMTPLLARARGDVDEVVAHGYALGKCNDPRKPAALTKELLKDTRTTRLTGDVAPYLDLGRPVRVSELNSAVCGGAAGVSDRAAAALWAPNALFALLQAGVTEADVHTWAGAIYAPIDHGRPRPLFDALELFARAAPAGSRVARLHLTHAGRLRGWATDDRGRSRVLLVNPGTGPRRVRLPRLPATRVEQLTAKSLPARRLSRTETRLPAGAALRVSPQSLTLLTSR